MVAADRILQTAVDERRRHDRPQRAHHAVARRDGVRRARNATAEDDHPAAHRRRDDEPAAHGGEDRSRIQSQPVVHVLDASRAVDVVSRLLSATERPPSTRRSRPTRSACVSSMPRSSAGRCWPGPMPRANRLDLRLTAERSRRAHVHRHAAAWTLPLETIIPYIDWTFFFTAWELKGRFPAILDHPQYGSAARELYDHATTAARSHRGRAPAHASAASTDSGPRSPMADDIVVVRADDRSASANAFASTCCVSRSSSPTGKPNLSLADFVAPTDSGLA